jgi:ABC-type branched-subunit amino acid transport system permease subunit
MKSRATDLTLLVAALLIALFPLSGATFYTQLIAKVMILAIFAMSLDLLIGYTGLVSFGHAAYLRPGRLCAGADGAAVRGRQLSGGPCRRRWRSAGWPSRSSPALSCCAPRASFSSW